MTNLFFVFLGGGLGAVMRYVCSLFLPYSTFCVNVLGSFLLGFLAVVFIDKFELNIYLKIALTVGFCGGFTTFSTFSFQLLEMLNSGQVVNALLYALSSVIIGIGAVMLGGYCAKFV